MNQEIRDKIVKIFRECRKNSEEGLTETKELEMDSTEVLEFILAIEDEFGIQYDNFAELSLHMETKEEMFDFLTAMVKQRRK